VHPGWKDESQDARIFHIQQYQLIQEDERNQGISKTLGKMDQYRRKYIPEHKDRNKVKWIAYDQRFEISENGVDFVSLKVDYNVKHTGPQNIGPQEAF
jgi:hypothetical protein